MNGRPGKKKSKRGRPSKASPRMISPEVALWTAVLEVAISDSLAADGARKLDVVVARAFLAGPSQSRDMILAMLDIDKGWFVEVILPPLVAAWRNMDAGAVSKRRGQRRSVMIQAPGLKPEASLAA